MGMTRKSDGKVLRVDLMMAVAKFVYHCGGIAVTHPDNPDPGFEDQLKLLNIQIREWWADYKKDYDDYWPRLGVGG